MTQVVPIDAQYLADNWMTSRHDFDFEIPNAYDKVVEGVEAAVDGYVYVVNGSQPTPSTTGVTMVNNVDTSTVGRTYQVYLTSGGVPVTDTYTYKVLIDLNDPTAEIIHCEHPADRYYTHNTITLSASDGRGSGIASIIMNTYDAKTGEFKHDYDIIAEADKNEDGTYTWRFEETGRNEIVVTDKAGRQSTVSVDVLIDKTKPSIEVESYYYKTVTE